MRIAILELHFHVDSLDALIKIFENSHYEVHVFTTKKNLELISSVNYGSNVIFHQLDSISRGLFLFRNRKILQACDIIFINTIASSFGSYLMLPNKVTTILRIHNINKQFNPNGSIYWPSDLLSFWKMTSYFVRQVLLKLFPIYRRIINSRMSYFTFPDDGLKNYVVERGYLSEKRIVPSIPLKINHSDRQIPKLDSVLNVTIIGATDFKRRTYDTVLKALKSASENKGLIPIHLTLLGKTSGDFGRKIIQELEKIECSQFSFTCYDKNVPEDEFVQIMEQTHLVISPIIQDSRSEIYHEYYGKTKTTGSILDFIKFGIVTLTPDYYNPPKEMEKYILKYRNELDLAEHINEVRLNKDDYISKSQIALEYVRTHFNKEAVFNLADSSFQKIRK